MLLDALMQEDEESAIDCEGPHNNSNLMSACFCPVGRGALDRLPPLPPTLWGLRGTVTSLKPSQFSRCLCIIMFMHYTP